MLAAGDTQFLFETLDDAREWTAQKALLERARARGVDFGLMPSMSRR